MTSILQANKNQVAGSASKVVPLREKEDADTLLQRIALEHESALRRFLNARLSGHPDYEDLLQETFLRVARQDDMEEKLSGSLDTVRSYLFSIATNAIRDRHRKVVTRRKYDHLTIYAPETGGLGFSAEQIVSAQEQLGDIKAAIMKLKPDCKDAFVLSRFEGLSYREIAERMGISISMVEKHIMNALSQIRRRVYKDY